VETDEQNQRLSRIRTRWSMILEARDADGDAAVAANRELLLRYYGAVYRYLLGMLRDAAAAEELAQEFAVRFLRGDFRVADPGRGRFRDFLKTAVRRQAIDHWRRQGKQPPALEPEALGQLADDPADAESERVFLEGWRDELLARAWEGLAEAEVRTGQPYHRVLRWKVEEPRTRSAEIAGRLGVAGGKPVSAEAARQILHRARERFARLLVEEVARSLATADPAALEQELIELRLLDYCKSALASG
jgi:RNA polymerase sigma-70 factor (ECF subfamily)